MEAKKSYGEKAVDRGNEEEERRQMEVRREEPGVKTLVKVGLTPPHRGVVNEHLISYAPGSHGEEVSEEPEHQCLHSPRGTLT